MVPGVVGADSIIQSIINSTGNDIVGQTSKIMKSVIDSLGNGVMIFAPQ